MKVVAAHARNDTLNSLRSKADSYAITRPRDSRRFCHTNSPRYHGSLPVKSNKYALTTLSIAWAAPLSELRESIFPMSPDKFVCVAVRDAVAYLI
jgi:hypothetical protein